MSENCNNQTKNWYVKKPRWRPFNVKLTETVFNEIRELVANGYAASITEFIRVAVTEKIEKTTIIGNETEERASTSYPLGKGNNDAEIKSHK